MARTPKNGNGNPPADGSELPIAVEDNAGDAGVEETSGLSQPDRLLTYTIVGKSPVMFHAFHEKDVIQTLIRGERKPADKTKPLEETAEYGLYTDEGQIIVPGLNIMSMIKAAGRFVKYDARRGITDSKGATLLYSFLAGMDEKVDLMVPEKDGIYRKAVRSDWKHDVRRGVMDSGGKKTAVGITRPKFNVWAVTFRVAFTPADQPVTVATVNKLVTVAGRNVGLGSFNGIHGGPFGKFTVAKLVIDELSNETTEMVVEDNSKPAPEMQAAQ